MRQAVPGRARYVLLAGAAAWACWATGLAGAQETEERESPPAAEGAREIPWDTNCSQAARQDEPNCEMSQMVIVPQSRQVLLRVELEVRGDGSGTRLVLQLPHGIYLPAGIALAIDGEAWEQTEVQTCDGNGCYAGIEIGEDAVGRLEAGQKLTVGFKSLSREDVTVPIDLNGFTKAYAKIR